MTRIDYLNDPKAPKATNIMPGATAIVVKGRKILLEHRRDNNLWGLPGGMMEIGETIGETAIREVREETGFDVEIKRLIGIYTDPHHIITFSDGEVRQQFSVCFLCKIIDGTLQESDESSEVKFFSHKEIADLPMGEPTRLRIKHYQTRRIRPYIG